MTRTADVHRNRRARPYVGRLAPSPTGAQHVGNARTYLVAWLAARAAGGRLLLRMEDLDSPRVKPHAARQALDDLRWLGLDWDEGPDCGGPRGPYVQTQRMQFYRDALERLKQQELVYPCTCSRSDIAAAASAPHVGQEGAAYAGMCRTRTVADAARLPVESFAWRFRLSPGIDEYLDGFAGLQQVECALLGDFVVAQGDGTPSYQLAVVVDDGLMGVTDVVRGDDLIPSTFRQRAVYAALNAEPPTFGHVPLVIGPDGRRLAKRHGDTRLSVLRQAGLSPQALVGHVAWSLNLRATAEPITPQELVPLWDHTRLPKQAWVFTPELWRQLQQRPSSLL